MNETKPDPEPVAVWERLTIFVVLLVAVFAVAWTAGRSSYLPLPVPDLPVPSVFQDAPAGEHSGHQGMG